MSDYIVKLIPACVTYSITEEQTDFILEFLRAKVKACHISASTYTTPAFIDCGSNLEAIWCPHCGAQLDFGWWGEAMDTASKGSFQNLSVNMPCCGRESTLGDLRYELPCGFACMELDVYNPTTDISEEVVARVEELIGSPVRMIRAHI